MHNKQIAHARITIDEARILWARIKDGKPVHGLKVSGYEVLGYNGTLNIGCHKIPREEVRAIGETLDKMEV